jgi:hypothetical protein
LGAISHELTHIKQVYFDQLGLSDNGTYLTWIGDDFISINELNIIVRNYDMKKYKELPWEKEAYDNQKILPKIIKESDEFKKLKGINNTLDFLIDSIL